MSSHNEKKYLLERAAGNTPERSAELAGIPAVEIPFIEAAIGRGELELPGIATKETTMTRGRKKKTEDEVIELKKPDFDRVVQLYKQDILPAQAKVGEYAQEQSTAYKEIKKGCRCDPGAAKLAFKLDQMEDAKRDIFLRDLYGLMSKLDIGISRDLVDQMGEGEAPTMPIVERQAPGLMSLN